MPTDKEAAGPGAGLVVLEKGKNFSWLYRDFEHRTVHPVAWSLYRQRLFGSKKNTKPRMLIVVLQLNAFLLRLIIILVGDKKKMSLRLWNYLKHDLSIFICKGPCLGIGYDMSDFSWLLSLLGESL